MNALTTFPAVDVEGLTQVELYALRDQIDAIIAADGLAYATSGPTSVRHRSGRRIYRHEAVQTLAFHRAIEASDRATPRLVEAARRVARDLEDAIRISFPEEA